MLQTTLPQKAGHFEWALVFNVAETTADAASEQNGTEAHIVKIRSAPKIATIR